MKKCLIIGLLIFLIITCSYAETNQTLRIPQFNNDKVNVWKTILYPHKEQMLKLHRHEFDRVLVALSSGTIKIINNKGKADFLQLEQGQAYYLTKDLPGELHTDENMGRSPITMLVIELKN